MRVLVLGSGMMGRAIAYDLRKYSNFEDITIVDKDKKSLQSAERFLDGKGISFDILDVEKRRLKMVAAVEKGFTSGSVTLLMSSPIIPTVPSV